MRSVGRYAPSIKNNLSSSYAHVLISRVEVPIRDYIYS
jgi:hypothetical protein